MKKILNRWSGAAATICLLSLGQAPAVYAAETIPLVLGTPQSSGSGCPRLKGGQETVSATLSPDSQTLSVIYDRFVVDAGGGKKMPLSAKKGCALILPIQVPQGWSITVLRTDYRGFVSLPDRARARLESRVQLVRGDELKTIQRLVKDYAGPMNEDVTESQAEPQPFYSQCGGTVRLRIVSTMETRVRSRSDQAQAGVDSLDFSSDPQSTHIPLGLKPCKPRR